MPTLVITSFLSAMLLFAVASITSPGDVFGATSQQTTLCNVNLRTSATLSAKVRKVATTATTVTVAATVTGGSWKTTCAGKTTSGHNWYRISAIKGTSVKSLYGVTYLYAATSLFKAVATPFTRYAACSTYLRTSPATTATARTLIRTDTKVLVASSVTGAGYSAVCSGKAVAGLAWYKISSIDGRSVQSSYGVAYLYAAMGLFKSAIVTAPAATPTPPITPEALPTATPRPTTTPAPTATPAPTPTPSPFANMTEGIDISHWQGTIDWTKVAAAGKKFAFMKASESTNYTDPTYTSNRQKARAAGLKVGAYHFAIPTATTGDGAAQADYFLGAASPAKGDLLPVLDLERSGGLSQAALTIWVKSFVGRVFERTGVRAVIYVSPSFWRTYMADTAWFATNGFNVLWVAHWTSATTPSVPGATWGGRSWTFWQYTSDGIVSGISGRVDLNRYRVKDMTPVLIP
jgi:GH25 family lysozyme M1 (1,4-beta-N-acetylmuramidase)